MTRRGRARRAARLLAVFEADPQAKHYGYDLMKTAGWRSGTLYPTLAHLESARLVTSEWEQGEDDAARPRRRMYMLAVRDMP